MVSFDAIGRTLFKEPIRWPKERLSVCVFSAVLHQMGIDHKRLEYPHGGRMETPSDVSVTGAKVVPGVFSQTPRAT